MKRKTKKSSRIEPPPTPEQIRFMNDMTFRPMLYWWIHHCRVLEMSCEDIHNRMKYIRTDKRDREISTRLRWLKRVTSANLLPPKIRKAANEIYAMSAKIEEMRRTAVSESGATRLIGVMQHRQGLINEFNTMIRLLQIHYLDHKHHRQPQQSLRKWMIPAFENILKLQQSEQPKCKTIHYGTELSFPSWF